MSRQDLFDAMVSRSFVSLQSCGQQYSGYINGIAVEDGSGYSFNVTMNVREYYPSQTCKNITIYYRTTK